MVRISWDEYQRIKDLQELDLEVCDYGHLNILNLGWESWGKWNCLKHEKEHVLCLDLCLPISRKIGCELVRRRSKRSEEAVKTNKPYYLTSCYLCGKELKGAGKHGIVKNRNDPEFWGVVSKYKILCLVCIGKEFWGRMKAEKRKTWRKYVRRGGMSKKFR